MYERVGEETKKRFLIEIVRRAVIGFIESLAGISRFWNGIIA